MTAYYNEIDPQKAAWLRELIARNLIAPGDVDERSIHDVRPDDLAGYTQCHFFAGVGIWSYALRLAGWPDDRPAWTGSCPCPSFSAAGKGEGFDDPRHLWPIWLPLIGVCRPPVVFGEQADAAVGHGWLDLVSTDLEASAYAVGAAILGACSVGAPHRRQRLYFVAHTQHRMQPDGTRTSRRETGERTPERGGSCGSGDDGRMAYAELSTGSRQRQHGGQGVRDQEPEGSAGNSGACLVAEPLHPERRSQREHGEDGRDRQDGRWAEAHGIAGTCGEVRGLADADGAGLEPIARPIAGSGNAGDQAEEWLDDLSNGREAGGLGRDGWTGPLNGFWRDADWIFCRDRKWRPVGPGTFPLATGAPARMVRLRGYGDGITAQTAEAFVRAYMEATA